MPATSVRDLTIKDNDLAVGTHGRGFWILDDITPLRQFDDKVVASNAFLFAPELAYRVRWNTNSDTPLPPDEPAGQNPPDGTIFNYYLKSAATGPVTLEILDNASTVVRRYSSADPVPPPDPELAIPAYWLRPPQTLSSAAGMHRFVWDMHYAPVPGMKPYYPMTAIRRNTAPAPTSPWVMPGKYSVVLTVDGQRYTQPLAIEMDPRVKTSAADLQKQFELSKEIYDDSVVLQPVVERAASVLTKLKSMREKANGPEAVKTDAAIQELQSLEGAGGRRRRGPQTESLSGVRGSLMELLSMLQEVDAAPTMQATQAVSKVHQSATSLVERWQQFASQQLAPLKVQP
jgi:hypothetical protein